MSIIVCSVPGSKGTLFFSVFDLDLLRIAEFLWSFANFLFTKNSHIHSAVYKNTCSAVFLKKACLSPENVCLFACKICFSAVKQNGYLHPFPPTSLWQNRIL